MTLLDVAKAVYGAIGIWGSGAIATVLLIRTTMFYQDWARQREAKLGRYVLVPASLHESHLSEIADRKLTSIGATRTKSDSWSAYRAGGIRRTYTHEGLTVTTDFELYAGWMAIKGDAELVGLLRDDILAHAGPGSDRAPYRSDHHQTRSH